MNTQEKEPELGDGVTSAEFWMYDGKLGRRWNVDPISRNGTSPLSVFGNSPITRIDILGNTDFYNQAGVWIGTDGKMDNELVVIKDNKIAKKLNRKYTRKGKNYSSDFVDDNNSFKLPNRSVLEAALYVFNKTSESTPTDPEGGKHEVMAVMESPSSAPTISVSTKLFNSSREIAIESYFPPSNGNYSDGISIHSHPFNIIKGPEHALPDGTSYYEYMDNSPVMPSEGDIEEFRKFGLNIIVGFGYGMIEKQEKTKKLNSSGLEPSQMDIANGTYKTYTYSEFNENTESVIGFYSPSGTEKLRFSITSLNNILESCQNANNTLKEEFYKKKKRKQHE